jgi:hypothetical protein
MAAIVDRRRRRRQQLLVQLSFILFVFPTYSRQDSQELVADGGDDGNRFSNSISRCLSSIYMCVLDFYVLIATVELKIYSVSLSVLLEV